MSLPLLVLALWACGDDTTTPTDSATTADSGTTTSAVSTSLADPVQGDPGLQSVHMASFAPDGTLAVADGAGQQLVAIDLAAGDVTDYRPDIDDIYQLIAEAFGDSSGPEANIRDITAHPITGRIYVIAERLATGEPALFQVNDDDTVSVVDLSDVTYSAVSLETSPGASSLVMALEWSGDHLIAAVTDANWTTNQVASVAVPVVHGDATTVTSTKTYHRTHNRWETVAPVVSMGTYSQDGEPAVVGTYTCTPVVRFLAGDLAVGDDKTVGATPFDFGGGKQVMDLVVTDEGLYASIEGMLPYSSDPWENWGVVRVDMDRLTQADEIDEDAQQMLGAGGTMAHDDASRVTALDGSYRIALVDDTHIVALQHAGLHVIDLTEE